MSDSFEALEQLLAERSTCRAFLPDQVPDETVDRLVALAQRSASWCNTQPWQLELTRGEETSRLREGLLAHVLEAPRQPDLPWPASYPGIYGERRRECGFQLYESVGIERHDLDARFLQTLRNFEFFDAPHVAIVTTEAELGTYGAIDAGVWLQSFLLGAQALGLAAAPQAALASYPTFFRDWFGLAADRIVVFGISFGYADPEAEVNRFRTSRADVASVRTWHG